MNSDQIAEYRENARHALTQFVRFNNAHPFHRQGDADDTIGAFTEFVDQAYKDEGVEGARDARAALAAAVETIACPAWVNSRGRASYDVVIESAEGYLHKLRQMHDMPAAQVNQSRRMTP